METKIININDLNTGDVVLVPLPFLNGGEVVGSVSTKMKTIKYPISDVGGGNKRRNYRDKNGELCSITAKEEGFVGDEKVIEVDIMYEGGSLIVNETDCISEFNLKKISKDHPKYDKTAAKYGDMFGSFFNKLQEAEDEGKDCFDTTVLMGALNELRDDDDVDGEI